MSSQSNLAKGQRTISSFFAPKSSSSNSSSAPTPSKLPAASPAPSKPAPKPAPKKTPTARKPKQIKPTPTPKDDEPEPDPMDEDEDEDEMLTRRPKRRLSKRTIEERDEEQDYAESGGEEEEEEDDDLYSVPVPKKKLRKAAPADEAAEPETLSPAVKKMKLAPPVSSQGPPSSQTAARYGYNKSQELGNVTQEDDLATKKRKEKLRSQWRDKLGRVSIATTPDGDEGTGGEDDDEAEPAEEEEVGPITKRFGGGKTKAPPKGGARKAGKLTPLDQQVVEIKKAHPDTILFVEVGYKFRFFGEDARVAAQNLSIMCIPGKYRFDNHPSEAHYDKFASASIPTQRLHVHVKRLVENGYKVGVVRQIETAALKAAGSNKSAPFERKLTNLYTKGTYIDDLDGLDGDLSSGAGSGGAPNTGFILCITEKPGGGSGADEKAHMGLVAVQPSTGEVIYDEFEDGFMRSEIETRLLHIAPCEFLIVGELTKATEKIVTHLSGTNTTVLGDTVRIERIEKGKKSEAEAFNHVSKFYADKVQASKGNETVGKNKLLDKVMELPSMVTLCLSALITHLSDYGLEHVLDLTKYFQSFSARSHMLLNANTLSSLEIYRNQTDYSTKGSLFWTLDKTKTKFGKRLLRNWVGRPLLDKDQLEERINAVEEFRECGSPQLEKLKDLLKQISYDLEKGLIRIYYGKATRSELLTILQTLQRIADMFKPVSDSSQIGFDSPLLNRCIASLPAIKSSVDHYLSIFNHNAASKNDKYDFFKESEDEEYDEINEHKLGIAAVESDLDLHRREIAQTLKRKSTTYITVSGIEYLTEVPNDKASLSLVPANWPKISGTKKVSRFHTPAIIRMLRERDQHKESLTIACDAAYSRFLAKISQDYQSFRDAIAALATLDCIHSLSIVSQQPNYCKPTFSSEPIIEITAGRHPMVELLLPDAYIPNSISLASSPLPSQPQPPHPQALLLTGPNMGGKSSFVRQTALICILAQIGSYVPADSAHLGLLDAVYTRMGAFDNMLAGESTFMVELSETADILKSATRRSLIVLDELGRGTSTFDGVAIAGGVLEWCVEKIGGMVLFVTHYPSLAKSDDDPDSKVRNVHMAFREEEEEEIGEVEGENGEKVEAGRRKNITFLYQVADGVAHRSYGLNVARLAGLPRKCLDVAERKSRELEEEMGWREAAGWGKGVVKVLESEGDEEKGVRGLWERVEGLGLMDEKIA